jgi:hypothetical protein
MSSDDGNFPATTLGGLQRACSINYAFIAIPENVMPLLKHVNCSIVSLPYKTYPISLAMAFSPSSPYTDFWNYRRVPSVLHLLDTRLTNLRMSSRISTQLVLLLHKTARTDLHGSFDSQQ